MRNSLPSTMQRAVGARLAAALLLLGWLAHPAVAQAIDVTQWTSGTVPLSQCWLEHDGDNPGWANPNYNDSAWQPVELDDLGAAEPGWRWYRLHLVLPEGHAHLHLLIDGGQGTYELYVNGEKASGTAIRPFLGSTRPTEEVYPLPDQADRVVLALRTYAGRTYTSWHLPLFLSASMGSPGAIEAQRAALQSQRLYAVLPSMAINLLLLLAGIAALALWRSQRRYREYLWLGLYLFLLGTSNLLQWCSSAGVLSLAWNNLVADPLIYLFTIMQIEFTFSFAGRRVGRAWRSYEGLLIATSIFGIGTLFWNFSSSVYLIIEAIAILPAALILPVLLFVWYRQGNREAGWLIVPSLFPAASAAIIDLASASIYTGWGRADFLANPIPLGPIPLQTADLGDLLFLLAIVVVMFFRFTRVSREQARAAAELEAAQGVQALLLRSAAAPASAFRIETAYRPAQEVGGDFFHTAQIDGSVRVVVGDVSGKGLGAAMLVSAVVGALDAMHGTAPAEVLRALNELLLSRQQSGFATCLCAAVMPDGKMSVANAGHLPPYRNGAELAVAPALPLGLSADAEYTEAALQLSAGDLLTFVSDGVVEARSAGGELFGFEHTREISTRSAEEIAQAAQEFGQQDDITVLALTFAGAEVAAR